MSLRLSLARSERHTLTPTPISMYTEDFISAIDEPAEGGKVTDSAGTHSVNDVDRLRQVGVMRMSILTSAIAVPFSVVLFSLEQNVSSLLLCVSCQNPLCDSFD